MNSIDILSGLIEIPTVSRNSNLALVDYARELLASRGIACTLVHDETGRKANLFASIGPGDRAGVMLSGHTDVVPVDGQNWSVEPFALTVRGDRLYGRGTADMKGFVACALRAALLASERELRTPLQLALSYDEEIGCVGVRRMIDRLDAAATATAFCIVGEPTSMTVATGHKGKTAALAKCIGREGHSALAPLALNAVHLACDFVVVLRARQAEIAESSAADDDYDVPYTTLHVGKIGGGVALNIVPNRCEVEFEIRNIAEDDPQAILADLRNAAEGIVAEVRTTIPEAAIGIEIGNAYPGLDTPTDAEVVAFVQSLAGTTGTIKVAFGTEGGLYAERRGIPTVICGPGSMVQGHKPDEFVTHEQIARCDAMLDALLDRLESGL